MNDLRNTFDIHCQVLFKTDFRFEAIIDGQSIDNKCITKKET